MRAVVQRVSDASVTVDGHVVGEIGPGLLVLVGVGHDDTEADAAALAKKLAGLRVFPDADGRMNLDVVDVGGSILVVSQFTLLGEVKRGRRPSYSGAAAPEQAAPLVDAVMEAIRGLGVAVEGGRFGAMMEVHLTNSGPVTLVVDVVDGRVS